MLKPTGHTRLLLYDSCTSAISLYQNKLEKTRYFYFAKVKPRVFIPASPKPL